MKIKHNRIRCAHCGKEIESYHRHDFVVHRCDAYGDGDFIAVDGGKDYLRRVGYHHDYYDISEMEDE